MKLREVLINLSCLLSLEFTIFSPLLKAQIISDPTLPNPSIVNQVDNNFNITGGTRRGNNLFHSFEQFSVPSNGAANFKNSLEIQNILTRVTGNSISNIDGWIRTNGTANLFVINPSGIRFGTNARLDLGGSGIFSTANTIRFPDGSEYSATLKNPPPLSGNIEHFFALGYENQLLSGKIIVQGIGHDIGLNSSGGGFLPFRRNSTEDLRVKPGKTLALIGGDITFESGIATAPSGHVEVASVKQGTVNLNSSDQSWNFNYQNVSEFGNIELLSRTLIDASGSGGSSIATNSRNLKLTDGSFMRIENSGFNSSGNIEIKATGGVELAGVTLDGSFRSAIGTDTTGSGKGGNVIISSAKLVLRDGAIIGNRSFSTASAGNIFIDTTETVRVLGFSLLNPLFFSTISTNAYGSGNAGTVEVSSKNIKLSQGGSIATVTFDKGNAADLRIKAELVKVTGIIPEGLSRSAINSSNYGFGNAGNLTIDTVQLSVEDGGVIASGNLNSGNAGNITINARGAIKVSGSDFNRTLNAEQISIIDTSTFVDEVTRRLFNLPANVTGDSGILRINSPNIIVSDNGQIRVLNEGIGDAGKLIINSNNLFLNNNAQISAFSFSGLGGTIEIIANNINLIDSSISAEALEGNGGNIILSDIKDLRLFDSQISASVGFIDLFGHPQGGGDGGNITINASDGTILLLNGVIKGNAVFGRGGNIDITSATIFSDRQLESTITASSQFGQEGNIDIIFLGEKQEEIINTHIPSLSMTISSLEAGKCLSPQRNGLESITLSKYGSPKTPNYRSHKYDIYILDPQERLESNQVINEDFVEPNLIGTRADGSNFLGVLCLTARGN